MTSLVYGGRRFGNLWPGLGEWASSNFGRSRAGKRHQVDGGGAGGALVAKSLGSEAKNGLGAAGKASWWFQADFKIFMGKTLDKHGGPRIQWWFHMISWGKQSWATKPIKVVACSDPRIFARSCGILPLVNRLYNPLWLGNPLLDQ